MADAGSLLGQLIGAALRNGSVRGGEQANAAGGLPGGLGDILGQVLGGAGGSAGGSSSQGGGMLGEILGQVLGGGAQRGGASSQSGGGLGDILGQVLGGGQSSGSAGGSAGGLPGGLGDLLGQVLGGGAASGAPSGASRGGASTGGLSDLVTDALGGLGGSSSSLPTSVPTGGSSPVPAPQEAPSSGRQPAGSGDLVKYGGLAVIGMLAFNAFRKWQAQSKSAQFVSLDEAGSAFSPAQVPGGPEAFSKVLLSAMIAAAQADGELDADELNHISGGLAKAGVSTDDREALVRTLTTPVDPRTLAAAATTPQAAAEIYAASVMAIRVDSVAEQQYLSLLAQLLNIEPGLKAQLDADLAAA